MLFLFLLLDECIRDVFVGIDELFKVRPGRCDRFH